MQSFTQSPTPTEAEQLNALSGAVGRAITTNEPLAVMLEVCVTAIAHHVDAACVRVWTFDSHSNLLELQAVAGRHGHTNELPSQVPLGISIVGLIAHNREPHVTNQVHNAVWLTSKDWIQQEQLVAFAGYPLIVAEKVVGVLVLFSRHPVSPTLDQGLRWTTQMMAVAVDRLMAQEENVARREAILFRLASQVRSSLDLDTILNTAVAEIRRIFRINRCNFLWCWANLEEHSGSATSDPMILNPILAITHEAKTAELPSLLGECSPEQVAVLADPILNLQPLQISHVEQEPSLDEALRSQLLAWGLSSYLLLPLETRSGQLGAIVCGHTDGARPWSDTEVELLQAVADQLAIAIDQAELYAQSRASAFAAQAQAKQLSEAFKSLQQAQAKLVQSEKMSSLGQLVAGIAHEINNPVNFISGNLSYAHEYFQDLLEMLQLYQAHYPDPHPEIASFADEIDLEFLLEDLEKLLNSMQVGSERIQQIVLSLRNFSRLDEAELKPVNLHDGLDNTLLILHNRLKSKGSRPEIEVVKQYGDLPKVECYAGPLNQVFMNLIGNAIDALEEQPEPRQITIMTERGHRSSEADPLSTIRIRIRDNGPGIPDDVQSHLFDPFFTTKPVGKGTGLGLSISYQIIVERHQGTLTCNSQPGEGAEFVIEIPIRNLEEDEDDCEQEG
jgi:signal transduction histidine kinase